jgi:hypothetical protein
MNIEIIEVETKLHVLATNFSNSYFSGILDQYQVVFKNSNVVEEMETLDLLSTKLDKRKPSIIINKDRALLASILDSYTYLISVYKTLAHVQMLSPKFKRYDMVKYLHDWCKASAGGDVKALVKEVVKEMIDPEKIPENLSRPELVKLLAEQMSAANKDNLYKKLPKR